ncbi:hypothetical protein J7I91_11315 [Pseudomonas sp. ISL-84]|nr:hypothetical protein [Pseudomonas sp. ISL-84]
MFKNWSNGYHGMEKDNKENDVERICLAFHAICLTLIDHECIMIVHTERNAEAPSR